MCVFPPFRCKSAHNFISGNGVSQGYQTYTKWAGSDLWNHFSQPTNLPERLGIQGWDRQFWACCWTPSYGAPPEMFVSGDGVNDGSLTPASVICPATPGSGSASGLQSCLKSSPEGQMNLTPLDITLNVKRGLLKFYVFGFQRTYLAACCRVPHWGMLYQLSPKMQVGQQPERSTEVSRWRGNEDMPSGTTSNTFTIFTLCCSSFIHFRKSKVDKGKYHIWWHFAYPSSLVPVITYNHMHG